MRRKLPKLIVLGLGFTVLGLGFRSIYSFVKSPKLTWPALAVTTSFHSLIRQPDGTLAATDKNNDVGFVASNGAVLINDASDTESWTLKLGKQLLWQGRVLQISGQGDEIAIVSHGSEKDHFPIQTIRFHFPDKKKTVFPNEWHCLGKGGTAIAYEPVPGYPVTIEIRRPGKLGRINTNVESLGSLMGIDTNGRSTVFTTRNDLYFQSNKDSWQAKAGMAHQYRGPRLVDDESCVVTCRAISPLMYNGNWIELMNRHRMERTTDDTYSRWLLIHDEVERLAKVNEEKLP